MGLDLSRVRFDARRDFLGVLMQQGRVQLDADWNDWVAQLARRIQAGTMDIVGKAVVPQETPDGFRIEAAGGNLTIGPGRIYVDGLLAENHGAPPDEWSRHLAELVGTAPVDYSNQPYFPEPPALPGGGPHLVYLDVWQREVTHLEQPDLVEPAVGVDTTGRVQTAWQVKILENVGNITCEEDLSNFQPWLDATDPSAGRLSSMTGAPPTSTNPCEVPPGAGYRGLENQLYRVEIHKGGAAGDATFKWSRDNATVATRVTHIDPARGRLTVQSIGRDETLSFRDGDWVEITDDVLELKNQPGELRRIRLSGGVDATTRTIELESALSPGTFPVSAQDETDSGRHTRIRRWDQAGHVRREDGTSFENLDAVASTGEIPVPPGGTRLFLEHGILVEFDLDPGNGEFRSGEHWLIAARTQEPWIDELDRAPPLGIHHHFARLALVTFPNGETDCRKKWPPVFGGESCDCTVCVSVEDHNSGKATIQDAIDAIKDTGGTICLEAGKYLIVKPLVIDDARSLRIRGQGLATVLWATQPGRVLRISGGEDVNLERFSVIGSASGDGTAILVSAADVTGLGLHEVSLVGVAKQPAETVALGLLGRLRNCRITDCVFVADHGVSGVGGKKLPVLLENLRATSNVLVCQRRGFAFEDLSLHFGACRLTENWIARCDDTAVVVTGGVLPGSDMTVSANVIHATGTAIRAGTQGLRIERNEVHGVGAAKSRDGIVLEKGLDPAAIDHAQIIGNRVEDMGGHGIAIRYRLGHAMIKQNVVERVGGSALIIEEAGSAAYLAIENNHFLNLAASLNSDDVAYSAVQLLAVDRVDVLDNLLSNLAQSAISNPFVGGVVAARFGEMRVAGNRLRGVGPPRSAGQVVAIRLLPGFTHAAVDDNTVERAGDAKAALVSAAWQAIRVEGTPTQGAIAVTAPAGNFTYINVGANAFFLTKHRIHVGPARAPNASARGNRLRGQETGVPLNDIHGVETCLFAENHCRVDRAGSPNASLLAVIRGRVLNASNNRLIAVGELDAMHLFADQKRAVVVGNTSTGRILLNGSPLGSPWAPLNIIGI